MITTGQELYQFMTSLNGGADIDLTLAGVLVESAKAIIEEERPWKRLCITNTALTVSSGNTWETAHSLATITNFSSFNGEYPLRIVSGNLIAYYTQVPFDRRIEYKDTSGTFVYDAANNTIYINGIVAFGGTMYLNYLKTGADVSLSSDSAVWTEFPARFLPLLGFYGVAIHKGAIDYDDINKMMLEPHNAIYASLHDAMTRWDEKLVLAEIEHNDPGSGMDGPRLGTIDRNA